MPLQWGEPLCASPRSVIVVLPAPFGPATTSSCGRSVSAHSSRRIAPARTRVLPSVARRFLEPCCNPRVRLSPGWTASSLASRMTSASSSSVGSVSGAMRSRFSTIWSGDSSQCESRCQWRAIPSETGTTCAELPLPRSHLDRHRNRRCPGSIALAIHTARSDDSVRARGISGATKARRNSSRTDQYHAAGRFPQGRADALRPDSEDEPAASAVRQPPSPRAGPRCRNFGRIPGSVDAVASPRNKCLRRPVAASSRFVGRILVLTGHDGRRALETAATRGDFGAPEQILPAQPSK
jgi:hypothetical protein